MQPRTEATTSPGLNDFVTLSGHDGDDAKPYQERDVQRAVALVRNSPSSPAK